MIFIVYSNEKSVCSLKLKIHSDPQKKKKRSADDGGATDDDGLEN